jgi:predicted MFS family arabinose efflux permease
MGTFLTQPLVRRIGERKTMIWLDVFAFLTIAYQAYSMDLVGLYLTRFGLGIYLGISGTVIPIYLVSISPP